VVEWADAGTRLENLAFAAQAAAISKAQAVIEFRWTARSSLPTKTS
jgi:hypothetical protein